MQAEQFFRLLVPVTFVALWLIESIHPARKFPQPKGRCLIGIGVFILLGLVNTLVPLLIPAARLEGHRPFDGAALDVIGGMIVGYVVLSFVNCLWHRNMQRFALPWRLFHQFQHSPQVDDMSGSALFHPTEMVLLGGWRSAPRHCCSDSTRSPRPPPDTSPPSTACSCTRTRAGRAGSASSSSGRERTVCITSAKCTITASPTCRCGTRCSAPSATRRRGRVTRVSRRLPRGRPARCWPFTTSRPRLRTREPGRERQAAPGDGLTGRRARAKARRLARTQRRLPPRIRRSRKRAGSIAAARSRSIGHGSPSS
jgi:hypothetical protein